MSSDTVPVSLTVLGIHIAAGAVRQGIYWRVNAAKYPDVVESHTDVLKARRKLEKRLVAHVQRTLDAYGYTAEEMVAAQKRRKAR